MEKEIIPCPHKQHVCGLCLDPETGEAWVTCDDIRKSTNECLHPFEKNNQIEFTVFGTGGKNHSSIQNGSPEICAGIKRLIKLREIPIS